LHRLEAVFDRRCQEFVERRSKTASKRLETLMFNYAQASNNCSYKVFQEVLNIDEDLAYNLEIYFRYYQENRKLEDVEDITPEIINEIKKHFNVDQ
jgi:hypothetical protein